jgi:chaperonin GroEL
MKKEVIYSPIPAMLKGLDIAANAVCGTLGPKGRNVLIDDENYPKTINEGGTIAAYIVLEDRVENAGANYIRNTTGQTSDDAGDGRSTTAALVQSLAHACVERPENPMEIRESLTKAGKKVLKQIAKQSIKITNKEVEEVAFISSEDRQVARLISEIVDKLGDKAVINVEDSKTFRTEYEIVAGYEAHVGFLSPGFITDKKTAKASYKDIPILVAEKKISNIADISPIFEMFKAESIGQCVIVCDDIDDAMLGMFVANNQMGTFKSLIVRASSLLLQDIAGVVGAKTVSDSTGVTFKNFTIQDLGFAKSVVSDANKTVFIGDGRASKQYAKELEAKADGEPNMYTAKNMRDRVAKINGGVAILKIAAATDAEREYKKPKAEDAIRAVKGALEEGVVEGGGMTLWRIAQGLNGKTIGEQVLKKAMVAPLQWIIKNSGKDYTEVILNMPKGLGYNAKSNTYVDLVKAGITDPAKVERCALENAISSVGIFITTHAVVIDVKNDKDN